MSRPANLVVTDGAGARQALADLVMAWARDTATGERRYILELDADHRGATCGCECPSCGMSLTAVNPAKTEFVKRPHFRYLGGAQRDECLVLATRAAALRARVTGLSGEFHEAWAEEAPVLTRISQVNYMDGATAMITLTDGRPLQVEPTGTAGSSDSHTRDGLLVPTIYLAMDDPTLAALAPEELRRRSRLQPTELCWRAYWN